MKRSKNNKAPSSILLKKLFRDMFKNNEAGFWQSANIFTVCYTFTHIFRAKNAMLNKFGQSFTKRLSVTFSRF